MEFTPLIAILENYEIVRKLDKMDISTCQDFKML